MMPPKRRLSGQQEDDEDGTEGSSSTTPEPGKKKTVLEFVRKYKKEDGAELCGAMTRIPNKRSEPGYYEIVENPIDVIKIQQKLKTEEYSNIEEFKADFDLMVANTKLFYKRGSPEYRDAVELAELVGKAVSCVEAGEEPGTNLPGSGEGGHKDTDIHEFLEELFGSVMTATDATEPTQLL